ncbi:hypothetical protein ARMSODRAFT_900612 [Armillaria solidipes]|uniref:Reverse transcriptase n=1 Tax=Armillaria solidipes TaxID=1076256 RepID=A0A2H3AH06_9AGAR|nr:hypothetical protein ARMSODRAFT_900612 [Armillaria solidipes]
MHKDKCNTIQDELFQPPLDLPDSEEPELETGNPGDIEYHDVSREEVRSAVFAGSKTSAPSASQINYLLLQWAWNVCEDFIIALIHLCATMGYHPTPWKTAIAFTLRKPGKKDYGMLRAWRLIQLLECLGKVLKCIQANRLAFWAKTQNLVPPTQFGGLAG